MWPMQAQTVCLCFEQPGAKEALRCSLLAPDFFNKHAYLPARDEKKMTNALDMTRCLQYAKAVPVFEGQERRYKTLHELFAFVHLHPYNAIEQTAE